MAFSVALNFSLFDKFFSLKEQMIACNFVGMYAFVSFMLRHENMNYQKVKQNNAVY